MRFIFFKCFFLLWSVLVTITIDISVSSYSPEYLLEQDVIIVTINYRLGILGFLCLPDAGVYGNAGLKDQVSEIQEANALHIVYSFRTSITNKFHIFSGWQCNGFNKISKNLVEILIM